MLSKSIDWRALNWRFSARPAYLVFICFAVSLCLLLSHWQWQRAQVAQQRHANYQKQSARPSVPLSPQLTDFQSVHLNGQIKRLFFLDNQIYQGLVGWHVLADVHTDAYSVLVNLGWQSKDNAPIKLADFPDNITVSGLVKTPEPGFMLANAEADPNWPRLLQQIHIPLLNQHFDSQLLPFVIFADNTFADLRPVSVPVENKYPMHLGYAIQWLLIAAVCVVGFLLISRRSDTSDD